MTHSPANLVPRVSWSSDCFNSADSVFFSTIKTIGKPRDPWDKIDSSICFDSISLQQMVATPTHICRSC